MSVLRFLVALQLRAMTSDERQAIERLVHSRVAPVRLVERARMVTYAGEGRSVTDIAGLLKVNRKTVRRWLKRFNEAGVAGLEERPRSGRPPVYSAEQIHLIAMTAVTAPATFGLECDRWTLRRLADYLGREKHIAISPRRLSLVLASEGIHVRSPRR
jgi:transposase